MALNAINGLCVMLALVALHDFSLAEETCSSATIADVYILADSSNSIAKIGYAREQNFTCNVAKGVPLGRDKVQIAYGHFSTPYEHIFNLDTYTDADSLCTAVQAVKQFKSNTNTAGALDKVRDGKYLSDTSKGARGTDVPKVLIIITDGQSDVPTATQIAAQKLRDLGYTIICVGVGSVDIDELDAISGKPGSALSVKGFGYVDTILSQLIQRICKAKPQLTTQPPPPTTPEPATTTPEPATTTPEPATTQPPTKSTTPEPTTTTPEPTTTTPEPTTTTPEPTTTTPEPTTTTPEPTTTTPEPTTTTPEPTTTTPEPTTTTPEPTTTTPEPTTTTEKPKTTTVKPCPPSDPLDIVYCVDASGSIGSGFDQNKVFLKELTPAFKISPTDVNIGCITFGTHAYKFFDLLNNKDTIMAKLDSLPYRGSSTGTNFCIDQARALLKKGRPGAKKILLVITDGKSDNPGQTAVSADAIHAEGVTCFAVGVGKEIDTKELITIASDPANVYLAADYEHILEVVVALSEGTCKAIKKY